jgi:hypothetical protein
MVALLFPPPEAPEVEVHDPSRSMPSSVRLIVLE